jgi:beta-lactamase class C
MRKAKKKGKYYAWTGTLAIVIITGVLVYPFFKASEIDQPRASSQRPVLHVPLNPEVARLLRAYENQINQLLATSKTPGAAIAIIKDSTIIYEKAFGYRSSASKDPVDLHTVFRLASVSKPFASFLTGILVEEKKLSFDDPVIKHVPSFQLKSDEQTRQLNISHVLSHTTGLPYHTYTNLVEEGIDLPTLLSQLKDVNLSNGVGKEYSYQNVAYSVVAEVIRTSTGNSYQEQMRDRVFAPLGMRDASMDYQSFISNNNIAKPHRLGNRKWVPTKINDTYYNVGPAGGVNASIHDMALWMLALLGNRKDVIQPETLEKLFEPIVDARSKNRNYSRMQRIRKSYYGLGWRILHYPNDTIVYHGGYVTGYRSEVAVDPKDKIAICILANAPGQLADSAIPIFFNLFNKHRKSIIDWDIRQRQHLPL